VREHWGKFSLENHFYDFKSAVPITVRSFPDWENTYMNTLNLLKCCAVAAGLAILTACGYSSNSYSYGSTLSPTNDSVVTTPSANGGVNVAIGSSTTFSLTFTTDDGATATNLSITAGLSALPAGWTGPTRASPAPRSAPAAAAWSISPITPTAAGSGSVTLNYSYVNNAGTSKTGTAAISYASTNRQRHVWPLRPPAQARSRWSRAAHSTVAITFTTSDGAIRPRTCRSRQA
jgi:hypothetical protein